MTQHSFPQRQSVEGGSRREKQAQSTSPGFFLLLLHINKNDGFGQKNRSSMQSGLPTQDINKDINKNK